MSISRLFKPFRQKLFLEGLLRAFLLSVMMGAVAVFAISLAYHIRIQQMPVLLAVGVGAGVACVAFLVFFFGVYYPRRKKVARRIDEMGLQERARTMLAYRDENSEMATLQRQDALQKIRSVPAKQMKMQVRKAEVICCAVCLCLALVITVLPYDVFAFGSGEVSAEAQLELDVKALIDKLREEVKDAQLNDDLENSLNEIIDRLEEDLQESDSDLEQAGEIQQAMDQMQELLDQAISRDEIGEALQKYELIRALGEAISDGDTEKVSAALSELQNALMEDPSLVAKLSETITQALEDSGVEAADSLYTALADFSVALAAIDITADSFEADLNDAFDTAESAILAALEEQAAIEEAFGKLEESMDSAKDEALGNKPEEAPEGETGEPPEGEMPEGEKPEGEMPEGEMPEGDMPEGEMPEGGGEGMGEGGEGSGSTMTEGIYDPVSGSTSYGEVFAAYYAEYLAALEAGEVPEELQEIIDQYYSSLS